MTAETAIFELPAAMKIDDCQALHAFLHTAQDQPVTINCGHVTRLGGLAAQLLLISSQIWASKGVDFLLVNQTTDFKQCISDLGLTEHLLMKDATA
jgi:anti-anti-sigma regulatory factor